MKLSKISGQGSNVLRLAVMPLALMGVFGVSHAQEAAASTEAASALWHRR